MPTDSSWIEQVEAAAPSAPSDIWRSHLMSDKKAKRTKELKHFTDKEVVLPPESDLMSSFDPMKNLHLWTMWRTAVNGRISDESRKTSSEDFVQWPFGRSLLEVPLNRFIRVEEDSLAAREAGLPDMRVGEDMRPLATYQYIYYGVPRVTLRRNSVPSSK